MTDDRDRPDDTGELGELLSLADGPIHFPEPARSELLEQMISTASLPRADGATVVPFRVDDRAAPRPRRTWAVAVAASLLLVVVASLAVVAREGNRSDAPADQVTPAPETVEDACEVLPRLAGANGLDRGSVQLTDVSRDDLVEFRRLLADLAVEEGTTATSELVDDAITRIRLLEIAIEASDARAAATAMTAARDSVGAVLDQAC